jgi:hypothetical protein
MEFQVFRVQILFTVGMIFAGLYTLLESGIQRYLDDYAVGWFLIYPPYHLTCMLVCLWFIIAKPGKQDFAKQRTAAMSSSSRSQP